MRILVEESLYSVRETQEQQDTYIFFRFFSDIFTSAPEYEECYITVYVL